MNKIFKKSGRKIAKKISLFSKKVNEDGREHIKENLIGHISHIKNVRLYIVEWLLMVSVVILLSIAQAYWYLNTFAVETYTSGGTYTEATLGKINSLLLLAPRKPSHVSFLLLSVLRIILDTLD